MRITIYSDRGSLDDTARLHAERRLAFALSRFEPRIRSVRLVVADQNGPRGGVDKLCKVEVRGAGWTVHVEEVDATMSSVVDKAADRVGRSVARKVERLRSRGT